MLKNKEIFHLEKQVNWLEEKTKYKTLNAIQMYDGQADILAYIYMNKGCTQYDIAKYLGLSRASVGISLKRMQKSGYIEVKPSIESKRSTCVFITDLGVKTLVKSDMILDDYISQKFHNFSEDEMEGYLHLLNKIKKNLTYAYKKSKEDK